MVISGVNLLEVDLLDVLFILFNKELEFDLLLFDLKMFGVNGMFGLIYLCFEYLDLLIVVIFVSEEFSVVL